VSARYVIGVDGGGTKTQAVLAGADGRVLSWGTGGPANLNRVPLQQVRASLREAITGALGADAGVPARAVGAVCLGIAGSTGSEDVIRAAISDLGLEAHVSVVSDVVIAFWAAIHGSFGALVIAGTGSCAYGVSTARATTAVGGWGYLLGDEGSAYDIGRRGMMAALRAADGRDEPTALLEELLQSLQVDTPRAVVPRIYQAAAGTTTDHIAGFAPVVATVAAAGDRVARSILHSAGNELGLMAMAVIDALSLRELEFDLALSGGVFKAGPLVTKHLASRVLAAAPGARIFVSERPPALGAARLALRDVGKDIEIVV